MNKKHISLILVIVAFLTIMVMSLWGKEAEISSSILVDNVELYDINLHQITIVDETSNNNTLKLSIKKTNEVKEMYYYVIALKVNPDNATDSSINVIPSGRTINSIDLIDLDTFKTYSTATEYNLEGCVYYYLLKFTKQEPCKIEFEFNHDIDSKSQFLQIVFEGNSDGGQIEF